MLEKRWLWLASVASLARLERATNCLEDTGTTPISISFAPMACHSSSRVGEFDEAVAPGFSAIF